MQTAVCRLASVNCSEFLMQEEPKREAWPYISSLSILHIVHILQGSCLTAEESCWDTDMQINSKQCAEQKAV